MLRILVAVLFLLGLSLTSEFSFGQQFVCISGNCVNGKGTIYFSGGDRYEGEFVDGYPKGKGTMYFSDGHRYEGDVVEFMANGKGTMYYPDGDRYEGEFVDGYPKGKGTIYFSEGDRYKGEFDGHPNGKGTFYYADGDRYEGDIVDGNREGTGTKYFSDGRRYEGNWVGNKANGRGTLYVQGFRYEGDFVDGVVTKGTLYWSSGQRYEGDFVNDIANGKGTMFFPDGSIDRQGIWKDGVLVKAMVLNEKPKPVQQQAQQIAADTQPPEITLQRGINVVAKARHTVRGKATDASGVAIVEVNGKEADLDADGNFSVAILLAPGANEVTITATDTLENTGYKTFSITREATAQLATPRVASQNKAIGTGKNHALLIGVNQYESSKINPLSEPVKDATALRNILVNDYTFDSSNVKQLRNPTRDEILDELDRLAERLTKDDNLLIFYAGHGYWDESRQEGYWLPSDADQNRRRDWISNGTIVSAINGIKTQHTLLVSDACFSGGILKTRAAFNDIPPATESLYNLPSRKAMTSGTLTEVPDKSVFVEYLIKRLEDNKDRYATSQDLFARMRTAVINNSPTRQVPQFGEIRETGDEGGDFIFVRR
jgi:hypothetical protein